MNQTRNQNELIELLDAMLSGEITSSEQGRLEDILAADSASRRVYFDYLDMHLQLRFWRKAGGQGPGARSQRPEDRGQRTEGRDRNTDIQPLAPLPTLSPLPSPLSPQFVGGPVFSYMVATVVLCLMLLGAWAYKINHDGNLTVKNSRRSTTSGPEALVFVGRITGMKDCRWSEIDTQTIVGALVALDRRYALASGLMEITYKSGARVILEGPCTYKVDSSTGGYLAVGKLTARVETRGSGFGGQGSGVRGQRTEVRGQKAHPSSLIPHPSSSIPHPSSFVVTTPTAIVTDLGTEFGVEVAENGDTTSYVFEGKVVVKAGIRGFVDSGIRNLNKRPATAVAGEYERELEAGDSVLVTNDATEAVRFTHPTTLPRFVRAIPSPLDQRYAEAERYAEMVLALSPVAYYRMEEPVDEKDNLVVHDSARGARHGKFLCGRADSESASPWDPNGRFGGALRLRGDYYGDHVVAPRTPDSESNQLSFSAWVISDMQGTWYALAHEGGVRRNARFMVRQRGEGNDLGAVVVPANPEPDEMSEAREGENTPFPYRSWQHVAFVADGKTLRLYRNGVEASSSPCDGVRAHPPGKYLILSGCNYADDPAGLEVRSYWSGWLDEVAIFHRALSPEEIKRLYKGPERWIRGNTDASSSANSKVNEASDK